MSIKNIKTVFTFDEDGYFEDTHIAQPNPRRPGSWFFPPRSTTVKPAMKAKFFYKIKNAASEISEWDEIPYPAKPEDFVGIEIPHASRTKRNEILRLWLRKFISEAPTLWREKQIQDENGNLLAITIESIPQPTQEELAEKKAQEVRSKRDSLLNQSDYLLQPDYPISTKQLAAVKNYRQALRDVPQQENFPESIVWPEFPNLAEISE